MFLSCHLIHLTDWISASQLYVILEFRHKDISEVWEELLEVSVHAWSDLFCWESSLRVCLVFPAWLNWREGKTVCVCEGKKGGRWREMPWSVFPRVLCYQVVKLEPCGKKHIQLFMRSAVREWGDKLENEVVIHFFIHFFLFFWPCIKRITPSPKKHVGFPQDYLVLCSNWLFFFFVFRADSCTVGWTGDYLTLFSHLSHHQIPDMLELPGLVVATVNRSDYHSCDWWTGRGCPFMLLCQHNMSVFTSLRFFSMIKLYRFTTYLF